MWKKIDPTILLLCYLSIFYTCVLIFVEYRFASDGQVFQVVSNTVSITIGALMGRLKPESSQHPNETTKTATVTTSESKPEAL